MNERHLHRWLAAEGEGREAEAERALFELFGALPQAVPSAAFADRVLVGAGVVMSRRARAAIAASLVLSGLAAAFLLPLAAALVPELVGPAGLLTAAAQGFASLAERAGEILSLGRFVAALGEALWLVAISPPVALTLFLMTALAALAFRWLTELLGAYPRLRTAPR